VSEANNNRHYVRLSLIGISLLYFILFIPINRSGTDDLKKISIFSYIDEYAQYQALNDMLTTSGKNVKHIVADFILHHHAYGYPFYFFSAVDVIPVKLLKLSPTEELQWTMLILRQQVVFFNIVTCLLLVHLWTGFRRMLPSLALFVFLLSIPAVTKHNMTWHPDALSTLFVVLTLWCLVRDNFQFKRWFLLAAVAFGMICSVKFLGPFFIPMILTYFILGMRNVQNKPPWFIKKLFIFGLIAGVVFLLTTPLILFGYYQNILGFLADQSKQIRFGWGFKMEKGLVSWYDEIIKPLYFHAAILIGMLLLFLFCIIRVKEKKNLNLLIFSAVVPLFIYIITVVAFKNYFYLYPVLLVFASTAGNVFYLDKTSMGKKSIAVCVVVFAALIFFNANASVRIYHDRQKMVVAHPSLEFYRKVRDSRVLDSIPGRPIKVIMGNYIYVPDSLQVDIAASGELITLELIHKENPDVIFFQKEVAKNFSSEAFQRNYIDTQSARVAGDFYRMALRDSVPGYQMKVEDDYAEGLVRVTR
jgi:hypothetical protein